MLIQVRQFFSAHPLLFLIILAPQVEYFTGSSQLSWLVGSPPLFSLFLVQNLGSYGLAVILIREAQIHWKKGWASVIMLGSAYGIVNEGIGAATLFNPDTAGILGSYGRWLGVNWVWAVGLVSLVHPLFSVSLPLIEHRLALPQIRGKSLVGSRGLILASVGLVIDAVGTLLFVGNVRHFFAGPLLWGASCVAIASFVAVARLVPKGLVSVSNSSPRARPLSFLMLGAVFIWGVMLGGDLLANLSLAPVLVACFIIGMGGLSLLWVFRSVGQKASEHQRLGLAAGLVASLIPMGFFGQLWTGIGLIPVVAVDLLAVFFFIHLWTRTIPPSRISSS